MDIVKEPGRKRKTKESIREKSKEEGEREMNCAICLCAILYCLPSIY